MNHLLCACHCCVPDSLTMKHFLRQKIGDCYQLENCSINHLHGIGCNRSKGVAQALILHCQSDTHTSSGSCSTTSVLNGDQSEYHIISNFGTEVIAVRLTSGIKLYISDCFVEAAVKIVIVRQNSDIVGSGSLTFGFVRIFNGTLEDFILFWILTKLLCICTNIHNLHLQCSVTTVWWKSLLKA